MVTSSNAVAVASPQNYLAYSKKGRSRQTRAAKHAAFMREKKGKRNCEKWENTGGGGGGGNQTQLGGIRINEHNGNRKEEKPYMDIRGRETQDMGTQD